MEMNPGNHWTLVSLLSVLQLTSLVVSSQSCCDQGNQVTKLSCCDNSVESVNQTLNDTCCDNLTNSNTTGSFKRKKIYIGAFVTMQHIDRHRAYISTKLALKYINNRTDILPNYELLLEARDTLSGRAPWALYALHQFITTPPYKVMLIGPESSEALEPVAFLANRFNLLQISSGASSPNFQMQRDFPYTFRIAPSSSSFSKAKAALIEYFGWKRVAILHEYDPDYFSPTVEILKRELKRRNISIIAVEGFAWRGGVSFQMEKLKNSDARIIIGEFSDISAQTVFCQAYKKHMYGSKYAWIMFGEFNLVKVFTVNPKINQIDCTADELRNVSNYMITTAKTVLRKDRNITVSGMTAQQFYKTIQATRIKDFNSIAAYKFDAMWAIALTLHNASQYHDLQNFDYKNRKMRKDFQRFMQSVSFEGVTGPVRFDRSKERIGTVRLWQLREGVVHDVGQHFTYNDKLEFFKGEKEKLWRDKPPVDHTTRREKLLKNSVPLIIIMWLLATMGVVCSLFFLYFNIAHRKNRATKMSSPKLNNVIILGAILCYIAVVLFGLDARFLSSDTYGQVCNVKTAVLTIGFSMAFGAMFSKTWRVHKIFTAAKTLKKMAIKDIHLLGVVAGLLFIDTIFLAVWFGVDPLRSEMIKFDEKTSKEMDVIIVPVLYQCTCRYKTYFVAVTYVCKGILLLFGLFLAWETRNVTIPALNDSKYIGMSVYNVVILSAIGAIVVTALDGTRSFEASYAISSLCLIICTTVTLLLVFVPKIQQFLVKTEDQRNSSVNVGLSSHSGRSPKHVFEFKSQNSPALHCRSNHSCKSTQTDVDQSSSDVNGLCWSHSHGEMTNGLSHNGKGEINVLTNTNDSQESNLYEVKMDDIHIESNVPRVYGTRRLGGKIVDLVETHM